MNYLNLGSVSLDWHNRNAADYVQILMKKYGQPSAIDPQAGGLAIWKKTKLLNTCFDRVEVHDEAVPHCKPVKHLEFIYAYLNYDVSPSRYMEVMSLSGSLSYDPLKKQLRARSGSLEGCIAILALATQVGEGHMSLNYVQANNLYEQWMISTQNPDKTDRMYDLMCFNCKHAQGDPVPSGFWPLAFPEGCM